jgi:ERCC4-related helicase
VWFLAPTVTLCEQQLAVYQTALPAYSIKMLSGQDATEHWSDQAIWDGVLENARIILSTHAILLDALTHGFVKMSKLALIIFDEGRDPFPVA